MKRLMMAAICAMTVAAVAVAEEKPAGGPPERGDRHPGVMGRGPMQDGGGMMNPMQFRELGLSKEQMQQMKAILTGSTNEMVALHARMKEVGKKQADLMGQDLPDEEAVLKAADELAQINAEMARIRMKQMLAAQKILTPEQRQKMRAKMKERMEKHRERMDERMKLRGGKAEGPRTGESQPEAKAE